MKYIIPDEVLTAHLSDEAVLLHVGSKRYFRLNSTAAWIWKGLEQGKDRSELLEGLCAHFEVERGDAELALDDQLARLVEADLLRGEREGDA